MHISELRSDRLHGDANGKMVLGRVEVRMTADEKSIKMIPEVRVVGWVQWRRRWSPTEGRYLDDPRL